MTARNHTLAILAISLAATTACSKSAPPRQPTVPVSVTTVRRAAVPYVVTANGVAEPMQTVAVQAQVNGILQRVNFSEGQAVEAGQVLFQIDARPYVAVLDQARGQLARDQATATNARRDATRYAALVKEGYVTSSQADQAEAAAVSAAATVAADRAAVQKAALDVANCTIRAPIIQRYYRSGNALQVRATASEGTGVPVLGTLAFVDNNVDSTTGTVLLKARFSNPEGAIWPGLYMSIGLQLYVDPNALTLPAPAVMTGQQGTYVYTIDTTMTAKQTPVQVSRTVDTLTIIASGLREGERVVVDGQSRLIPGSKVAIKGVSR